VRTYNLSRIGNKKFVYLSLFVAILLVIGAYYIVLAHALSGSNNASEETAQPIFVAPKTCGSAKEAFEKGYVDALITFRPEVSTVAAKKGESVTVKLFIMYQRRDPAPEVIELRSDPNSATVDIPRDVNSALSDSRTYLRVNDYMTFEPEVIKIRDGETVQALITIKFPDDFLCAINNDKWVPMPISVYRPGANENFSFGLQEEDPFEVVPQYETTV
jgi:hypothetical protein